MIKVNPLENQGIEFELDHIGIATPSLEEGKRLYELLGLGPADVEEVPSEKVRVAMYELGNGARVELLESTDPESAVGKFLKRRGPGIHHICLRVKDIRSVMNNLLKAGVRLTSEEPRPGAHNCLVTFIHPSEAGGVLIELSQRP